MGIFSKQNQQPAYVPPPKGVNSTLLGASAQPEAGQYDDLNRSPATTVELRFRRVQFPGWETTRDHAFIVVTDNATGKQWVHQAGPGGPAGETALGSIRTDTDGYNKDARDYEAPAKTVARFTTDASADSVQEKLTTFGNRFSENGTSYELPPDMLPMIPRVMQDAKPTRNSNYYGGLAWQHLTGSVPKLPDGIDAPGWGDHIRDPYGAIP